MREQQLGEGPLVGHGEVGQGARPQPRDEVVLLCVGQVGEPGAVHRTGRVVERPQPGPVGLVVLPVEAGQRPVQVGDRADG